MLRIMTSSQCNFTNLMSQMTSSLLSVCTFKDMLACAVCVCSLECRNTHSSVLNSAGKCFLPGAPACILKNFLLHQAAVELLCNFILAPTYEVNYISYGCE